MDFISKKNYRETYELLLDYYGFADLDPDCPTIMSDPLWSEFETSMSLLDKDSVLEANTDAMPSYSSDDFRDRDRYTFLIEMERILGLLTTELYKAFEEFILAVQFPMFDHGRSVNIDRDAVYLTFNYTDTLSQYYAVPDENILFIHGKANTHAGELILGHGVAPENFKEKPAEPPSGLSDEDLERWMDYQSEQYDYSFELGKDAINQYFSATFKGTDQVIKNNEAFFAKLGNIDEVYVLGHSLADVDLPYFKKLVQSVRPDAKWVVTFYDPDDEKKHGDTLKEFGIANVVVVRMEQI
ncbi:bacteriophage abortive infection AbiH family protein [Aeromonas caviae]|uniref:bacteriophage abortive infection AbiH family protein n=1 Tax=Aeromonas caviae TaxID=648 RepID=UPI0029D842E7|nr:bacteriophage abortive infection AbiH family protein [Aeromonas caviae]MDX7755865.1 bacteriophage abortive infection AbiH family protein [Aeromonas caviae]